MFAAGERNRLSGKLSISIVVATLDRPEGLRQCLRSLTEQTMPRPFEIIVVDNNPASGVTAPVLVEFPGVVPVTEPRRGLAYARNKGFIASTGQIVVTTDDDITMPREWLGRLTAPFDRPEVMVVTGNVIPRELETRAQQLFEAYGGLGRGLQPQIADGTCFHRFRSAVPTWKLGATANAAFRAEIFSHPQIGLMDEALGPGMPSGVGEDTYLFYRVLEAGYTIVYEPNAFVWHQHRRGMADFQRQLYNYSKGHVAYHLTTLFRDHDLRALVQIGMMVPAWHILRAVRRLCGTSQYPLLLILLEVSGNLAGPWSLWRSRMRVRREGRSGTYIPVARRSATAAGSGQLAQARNLKA